MDRPAKASGIWAGLLVRRLLPAILLVPMLFGLLLWQIRALLLASDWVDHTDRVLSQIHEVESRALELQSGLRGYALTGHPDFLVPYRAGQQLIGPSLDRLGAMVRDNPAQEQQLNQVRSDVERWLATAEPLIEAKRRGVDVGPRFAAGEGNALLESIKARLAAMSGAEASLRASRTASTRTRARFTALVTAFGFLALGIPLGLLLQQRNRWERRLLLSEYRFRALSDQVKEYAIYMLDPQGHIQTWGAGAEQMYGYGRQEALGRHFSVFFPEEDARGGKPQEELQTAAARGQYQVATWRLRKGGGRFWAEVVTTRLDDARGRILGYAKVVRDLTEHARAESALRASEERLRAFFAQAPDAILVADLEGRYTEVNPAACRMLGYDRHELVGKNIAELLPPEDAPRLEAARAYLLTPEHVSVDEWRVRRRDGRYLPVEVSARILPDGRWQAFARDISERKRGEAEQHFLLELGTALSRSLNFQESLDGALELMVGPLADCAFADLLGEDRVLHRSKVVVADPAQRRTAQALQQVFLDRSRPYLTSGAIQSGQPVLIEQVTAQHLLFLAQSQQHLAVLRELNPRSLMVVPLLTQGHPQGALALLRLQGGEPYHDRDLRLAREIASRVALAMENSRLYAAAQRAVAARDDVLGIVAHDLRNPLSVIVMQSELLRRRTEVSEPDARKATEIIQQSAKRLDTMIRDLLDVTRLEAGHLAIDPRPLATPEVLATALETQRPIAAARGLELREELAPQLPPVWADRDRLLQILENLLGNAVKFTAPGGSITVGAAPQEGQVLFWVADTGRGIALEDLPHLFDRFWQAGRSDKRGAGLGLSIVKGIVEAHGGRVWVESVLERGTRFLFTLPSAPRPQLEPPASHA